MFYDPDAFEIVSDFREGILAPGESTLIELQYFPSETLRNDVCASLQMNNEMPENNPLSCGAESQTGDINSRSI